MARRERPLPAGAVTFFLTDIEGSSPLLRRLGEDAYISVIEQHHESIRRALGDHDGVEFNTAGDAFLVAFEDASDAVGAALQAQQLLGDVAAGHHPVRVRMAVHTGPARVVAGDYVSLALNRTARVLSAAHGGQVLLTGQAVAAVTDLPPAASLRLLGTYRLRDFDGPVDLYGLEHPSLPWVETELRARRASSHNLPSFMTPLVGRAREIGTITELLLGNRLVTVIGPGGVGKTRAAVAVGADVSASTADGVAAVLLGSVTDPDAVRTAFADGLGVRHADARSVVDAICDEVDDKDLTIIVDNCEHVREAAADVVRSLLLRCPEVRVLATSRSPLGLPSEQLYRLPTMTLPTGADDPETVAESEAVQLFVDRAQRADHDFELTGHESTVAAICERLDGLPFAVELAAAGLRSFTADQLLGHLDDALLVLASGDPSAAPRQIGLQGLLDWSRRLLSPEEDALFRRLSVFRGGWDLRAAGLVCADGRADVLTLSNALVDQSLIRAADGEGRYSMLQLVADYAAKCLDDAGERRDMWGRHLRWCLDQVRGQTRARVLEVCSREGDNQRAALHRDDPALAREQLELAAAVSLSWARLGRGDEAVRSLERGLEGVEDPEVRVRSGLALAFLEADRGRLDAAESAIGAARVDAISLGGRAHAGELAYNTGRILLRRHRLREARRALENAIEADVAAGGDGIRAVNELGVLELIADDPAAAAPWFSRARDIAIERDDAWAVAQTSANLAEALVRLGRTDDARRAEQRALRERRRLGDSVGIAHSLFGMGNIEAARGNHEQAVRLIAAADALCTELDHSLRDDDAAVVERSLVAAREALGPDSFSRLWIAGLQSDVDEVIAATA